MKKVLTVLTILACAVVLVLGNLYWKDQIANAVGDRPKESEKAVPKQVKQIPQNKEEKGPDLLSLTKNWPEDAAIVYEEKAEAGAAFSILLAGSEADGWMEGTKKALTETYGETVTVDTKSFEMTSAQFIQEGNEKELAGADLVVLEPLTLKDNGIIEVNDRFEHIKTMIKAIEDDNLRTGIILQPSYPIHGGIYYPQEVDKLKSFAEENGIAFISHWSEWPDYTTEALNEYVDKNGPNEKGYELWSKAVSEYLIAE